uniref:Shaggy-related protein kinase eta n=1 Tax=Arundo donax TaxID=35708 RepID=A0A0A9IQ26_ARUDO
MSQRINQKVLRFHVPVANSRYSMNIG